jgi:acyl-CoA reductase-like NAD-dependent aldehyde dehydrogenase
MSEDLEIVNPATGEVFETLRTDSPESVRENYECAVRGQSDWAKAPLAERKKAISGFIDKVAKHKKELAEILTRETGKPLSQSINEINALPTRLRFFIDHAAEVLADKPVHSQKNISEVIRHEPLGVIANISAWNYPYFVGSNVFVPALLAGNAVLYKPSEHAALTGKRIIKMMTDAGVPANAFIAAMGGGEVGAELMKLPLAGVFFTGSHATGMKIAQSAANSFMKVQLELGGKDPAYAAEDADAGSAAESLADGAFYNCGQSCCAVERVYVHEKIYEEFLEEFLETVQSFKVGDPAAADTYIGPLARREQIPVLEAQIRDAAAKGARILAGGKRIEGNGFFFEPTVLVDVDHSMSLMREESFGPIIGIQKVGSDEEAQRLMNDTRYGLTAAVYTPDEARARQILEGVDAGSAYWNCCDRISPHLPWSGRNDSGMGITLSKEGIAAFTRPKAWHLRRV